jgi:hypothetical protein
MFSPALDQAGGVLAQGLRLAKATLWERETGWDSLKPSSKLDTKADMLQAAGSSCGAKVEVKVRPVLSERLHCEGSEGASQQPVRCHAPAAH